MIKAYVTNLGKYNEGDLYGEYLKLPATKDDLNSVLSRIGMDDIFYKEFFISNYISKFSGTHLLDENENINELNYLASLISNMKEWELEKFEAAVEYGNKTKGALALINLSQNLKCYEYYHGLSNHNELGRYMFNELEYEEISERLWEYINYEAYGRDYAIKAEGEFINGSYILRNDEKYHEYYKSSNDIPDEYKIYEYSDPPDKLPIKEQIEIYDKIASSQINASRSAPTRDERT